jgi:hypothetical protein
LDELRTVGISYAALKGVYRIRQWDGRPLYERNGESSLDHLARILAEREAGIAGPADEGHTGALLARVLQPRGY